jgi:hypothetical protein
MGQAKLWRSEIERLHGQSKPSLAAVHEAGHAVARFLTAPAYGFAPGDAVVSIEMRHGGGTTFGPLFTAEIDAAARRVREQFQAGGTDAVAPWIEAFLQERPRGYFELVTAEACESGANVGTWIECKIQQCVAGAVAEALHQKSAFGEVIGSVPCISDVGDIARAWEIARLALAALTKDGWKGRLLASGETVRKELSTPPTWNALLALARNLPKEGTMTGRDAWEIFSRAQGGSAT